MGGAAALARSSQGAESGGAVLQGEDVSRLGRKTTSSKAVGLKNAPGEQNCFLNVVIQALWRQKSCREFFFSIGDPWKKTNPVLIALAVLMTEYKYSEEQILPPDQVRAALAEAYLGMNRFQLGEMDDAAESFQAILVAMHNSSGGDDAETVDIDKPCKDRESCLGHQVFALDFVKEAYCMRCHHVKQVGFGAMFTSHLYASEVVERAEVLTAAELSRELDLGRVMRSLDIQRREERCENCQTLSETRTNTLLMSFPKVLCLNIVWPQAECDRTLLRKMLELIETSREAFRLSRAFAVPAEAEFIDTTYDLTGMICFYSGGHYVFFGIVGASRAWYIFDDHDIKQVGTFRQVMERCDKAKYQPVCLFYEKCSEMLADGPNNGGRRAYQTMTVADRLQPRQLAPPPPISRSVRESMQGTVVPPPSAVGDTPTRTAAPVSPIVSTRRRAPEGYDSSSNLVFVPLDEEEMLEFRVRESGRRS